ncbi:alpha/beta hydrolase [Sphingomonas sp. SUN039]|uniref:alpha/beta hydrolase n=1 Tax=Sphingomonas sp. SUN039 TaxID=2937787 RepID=UPI00216459FD|nr:alpha/beta hydrolase [Sphingomonas sp. SUN039]UVO55729.1 alpha/beta fold hydrolase [Sphingomonas sp. SUN039]
MPVITRHFIDVGTRRVHYRKCGYGPALLMVHQSPRSSKEYESLMRDWGAHFTCIAPDTPGFGQSEPLPGSPAIDDFADANIALLDALGLGQVAAYGFHSGGIILVTALKRHPERFSRLAVGGYAIWTPEEMAIFGESYLPPFVPSAYGEHLTWLWNRILEQSWVFPWFDVRDAARLLNPHDDPAKAHAVVMEMLDAGDAYRAGYGAVLRAPRDIPPVDAATPPVLITAYDGDPLQAHIDRLGPMPKGWSAAKVATPAAHQAASLAFLMESAEEAVGALPEAGDAGFVHVTTAEFDGLIHWQGDAVDPPGHGLSDDFQPSSPRREGDAKHRERNEPPGRSSPGSAGAAPPSPQSGEGWDRWQAVFDAFEAATGRKVVLPPLAKGDPDLLYPDLSPDRFGAYLAKAWSISRAATLFEPWYEVCAATALPIDPARITPEALALDTRNRLRAPAAKALHLARLERGEG